MTNFDLQTLTIAQALGLIRRGELSPVELAESVLSRASSLNERMGIFITITADLAVEQAKRGRGILAGIPVGVKDVFDTKGIRTTAGSRVYAERVPSEDATA